jgi:histidinol phosphatase-like PHP family hydrolase/UDP-2,3-diacylglucosamine pyrophosphatase LpxH
MNENSLTVLAISDLHHTGLSRQTAQLPQIRGELAQTLLKKVFLRLRHMGIQPDLTLVLGDLVEDGTDRNAYHDFISLHGELTRSGIPFLVVPGNHDGDAAAFNAHLGSDPGLHKIGGYGFVLFSDSYNESHECVRSSEDLALTKKIAEENPGLPLVAVQHPPIYPHLDSLYPYRPTNAAEIIDSFEKSGVILSLSGHFHKGQKARAHENVLYHTVAALSEAPFRFSLIRLCGTRVEVEELNLAISVPHIIDVHCHTEHAYCGTTVDTAPCIALSQALGVACLCITEHAFQLYFDKSRAMSFKWQGDPSLAAAVWDTPERGRMAAYRRFAEKLNSPFVKTGLELDLFDDGKLLIAPEDMKAGWDILIGAVHGIQGFVPGQTGQEEAERLFIRDVERLVEHDIDVLAHPFRFFVRNHLAIPTHLYPTVAGLLADSGVAAEVNFHTYQPEVEFIQHCVEKGVKLALASDAHDLAEVGEFWPHVNVLRQAGVTSKMFPETLFSF